MNKKGNFKWTPAVEAAFIQLKEQLMTAPILALPDFSQLFELETDANQAGIGVVLMQKGRPIAYFSQAL